MASDVVIRFRGDASSAVRAGAQTQGALAGVRSAGSRLAGALATATKVGALALAAGLAVSVKEAIGFESSFAGVRKTVDATEPQFQRLADGIREMAREIPASANELNAIAESAGQLGIKREAILGFTRVVADLGETTNLVGEEAAASLARISNVMGTSQKNFDRLGSTIVALGNAGASTEAEIVEMGLRIAGAGKVAGLTEADVLGFANALASVGIEAQAGGTAISRVMVDIANAVADGGEKLDDFAEVAGLSSDEFARAFEEDAAGAIVTFIEGLGKIDEEGGNVFKVLEDLGLSEIRVRDALLRAAGAGDLFRDSLKLGSKAWKENTALTEEAQKRYETTAAALEILRNNVGDIAVSVGEVLIPAIAKGAKRLVGLIDDVREADGLRAKISVVFEGIKSAVGGLIDAIRTALFGEVERKPLKLETGQIIEWKTTRQTGLVASISTGLRSIDWSSVGERVGAGISKSIKITADFVGNILSAGARFIDAHLAEFAELGAKMILAIVAKLLDPAFWIENWELVLAIALVVFRVRLIALLGQALRFAFSAAFKGIGAFFLGLIDDLVPFARRGATSLVRGIQAGLRALPGTIRRWVILTGRALGEGISQWIKTAGALVLQLIRLIARILDRLFPTVRLAFTMGLRAIRGALAGWISAAVLLGVRVVAGVGRGLAGLPGRVAQGLQGARTAITRFIGAAFDSAWYIGRAIVNGILSGLSGLFSAVKGAVEGAVRDALSKVNPFSPVEHGGEFYVGRPLVEGAIAGIQKGAGGIRSALEDALRGAVGARSGGAFPMTGLAPPGALGAIGARSFSVTVNLNGPVIGGGSRRELGRDLANVIAPELRRQIRLET